MQNPDPKKTKSAPSRAVGVHVQRKKLLLYVTGALAALFLLLSPSIFYSPPKAALQVNGQTISLEIVRTAAAQEKGLGGRDVLASDAGMLFVQSTPAVTCFWMKDMRFPLDIIWLSATKQVVTVRQNIAPKTYPKTFCPDRPAKYVIELNAGQVNKLGIAQNQTLHF